MSLDLKVKQDLEAVRDRLHREGRLVGHTRLATSYDTFRRRFGPAVLASLDGEALLSTLKPCSNRDSLAYWLEFKDDEEFPALFGSIAGRSALKFGVYWSNQGGAWMTGSPLHQYEISLADAVGIARRDRDQLLLAVNLIDGLLPLGTDDDYQQLQALLARTAPDVHETIWAHKYLALLFPDQISDIHVARFQQLQLIRLLQVPPRSKGRYVCEGCYLAIAEELGLPLHTAATVVNERNGPLRNYWQFDLAGGPELGSDWESLRDQCCIALHLPEVENLTDMLGTRPTNERMRTLLSGIVGPRVTPLILGLAVQMREDDIVVAVHGSDVLGIGRVAGSYAFAAGLSFRHRRPVEWISLEHWYLPRPASVRNAIDDIQYGSDATSLVDIEGHILYAQEALEAEPAPKLTGVPARIQAVLERKGQVILYGPPGTGKTYWALKAARELAARSHFELPFDGLSPEQQSVLRGETGNANSPIRFCTFHPGYGYEDFIEGYRPAVVNDRMIFQRRDGIFKQLCDDAARQPSRNFYLIIDEINRGDVPRIFGELLTLLEKNKRGLPAILTLSAESFAVPQNVYVIGTMNTADRSIALLDTALRRRFGFLELMPNSDVLEDAIMGGIPLGPWLQSLNRRICDHIGRDARNLQIGHAYLLAGERPIVDFAVFVRVLREDILPLLEEYCYEDYAALERIMGSGLVDAERRRFREELFNPARQGDLVQALLAPSPEIATSPEAVQSGTGDETAAGEQEPDDLTEPEQ